MEIDWLWTLGSILAFGLIGLIIYGLWWWAWGGGEGY